MTTFHDLGSSLLVRYVTAWVDGSILQLRLSDDTQTAALALAIPIETAPVTQSAEAEGKLEAIRQIVCPEEPEYED
jgi:hypothetical protein